MENKAYRRGEIVSLPKYRNAEMLALEFLVGAPVIVHPMTATETHTRLRFPNLSARVLTKLTQYINANI